MINITIREELGKFTVYDDELVYYKYDTLAEAEEAKAGLERDDEIAIAAEMMIDTAAISLVERFGIDKREAIVRLRTAAQP